jgi:integrase
VVEAVSNAATALSRPESRHRLAANGGLRLGEAVTMYLAHLQRRGRRPATVRGTDMVLRSFRRWAGDDAPVSTITLAEVELGFSPAWEQDFERRNQRLPSTGSARRLRVALRGLFDFLDRFDLLVGADGSMIRNPLGNLEIPAAATPRCEHLTPEAAATLIAAARTPRQQIVVALLLWTGIRAGEATALADADVDLEQREIRVRAAKTQRGRRTIPLLPQLEQPIRQWRTYRDQHGLNRPGGHFLVTGSGTALGTRYIWKIVRTVSTRASIQTSNGRVVTPHTLRRTYATEMLNHGVRLETVSRLLGHAATTITEQAYARLTDDRIRQEVEVALAVAAKPVVAARPLRTVINVPLNPSTQHTFRATRGSSTSPTLLLRTP